MAKIMIVDDDATTVSLLSTLLEIDGFQVVIVKRGADVLPKAEAERPDLIMLDYHLTDMEGVDIVYLLRKHATLKNIPILVASGLDVSEEVLAAGANQFLIKPFEPGELPIIFNKLISG